MRTHRLTIICNSIEAAKWYEEEVVQVHFCDLTHWYCGLDGAGDDTPDECIIYRGIIHPERISVEFNANSLGGSNIDESIEELKLIFKVGKLNRFGFEVLSVSVDEIKNDSDKPEVVVRSMQKYIFSVRVVDMNLDINNPHSESLHSVDIIFAIGYIDAWNELIYNYNSRGKIPLVESLIIEPI